MKAFTAGTAAAILISVIAGVVMNVAGPTSATKFSDRTRSVCPTRACDRPGRSMPSLAASFLCRPLNSRGLASRPHR